MEESLKIEITKAEAEQFEAMLDVVLKEIDASLKRMDEYEASRLKNQAETDLLRARIKEMLNVGAAH